MIVYRSLSRQHTAGDLQEKAAHVSKHLFPSAKIIHEESSGGRFQLILKEKNALVGLDLFETRLGPDQFEWILRHAADLEAMRKKHKDGHISEIGLCILAYGFSEALLKRVHQSFPWMKLYDWSTIQSDSEQALLVREISEEEQELPKPVVQETKPQEIVVTAPKETHRPANDAPENAAWLRFKKELSDKRLRGKFSILK